MNRFWNKVAKAGPAECWLWTAGKSKAGYGRFNLDGTNVLATRVAWSSVHGPIKNGACVLHRCDTPACVNPAHLFLGSRADNVADMLAKGRERKPLVGAKNGRAKLRAELIAAIRNSSATNALARRYGVHRTTIQRARRGLSWRSPI